MGLEGTYRIHGEERELFESFVAAPGPAGWRYFARVFAAGTEDALYTVDLVVDGEWALVRYRERHAAGEEVVVVPSAGGMEAMWRGAGQEQLLEVPQADIVWSRSPSSLLVAERRARVRQAKALQAVRIGAPGNSTAVLISLNGVGDESVNTGSGSSTALRLQVKEQGRTFLALIRHDAPLSAEGWFDLIA